MDQLKQTITPAYQIEADEALTQLGSNPHGLSETEATMRLQQYGPNELQRIDVVPGWYKFIRQFKDLLILLLMASAGISVFLDDYRTASILALIVLINASIGFWQEHKAENIMAGLESLVVSTARVRRDGQLIEVSTIELVPGDVIHISEGDSVPADARIIHDNELSTNDFALTGESNPSRKFSHGLSNHVELARRHNLVYMGTTVATGDADCVVISTGMQTELGRIANLSQEAKQDQSPLQREINYTAQLITKGTLGLAALLVVVAMTQDFGLKYAFVFAIGIASAMIPQGLPAAINITLTQAAGKLAKAKALVKRLSAVETLGATGIILTDKTGTLTKNQMTVEQLYVGETPLWVSGTGYKAVGEILSAERKKLPLDALKSYELFFVAAALASNARVRPPDDQHGGWHVLGDPTEGALITLAHKYGLQPDELDTKYPELHEFPFDSIRKRMSSIRDYDGKKVFCKGSPESILDVCTHVLIGDKLHKITSSYREHFLARSEMLAGAAMRNLALAYKDLPANSNPKKLNLKEVESGLTLLGMASMIDPPREEIPAAMQAAARAHIPVSIITGDSAQTATAVALKAGLASSVDELRLVPGNELADMEDDQIIHLITRGKVIFSRVAPEDKLRIVELGKAAGKVVAVTGDGINDAPALKRADIGVAMGLTGTDVSKQSADIILLDDSFHSLVSAIQQGRVIFQNIRKIILSILTGNASELFTILISLVAFSVWGIPIAISVVLILAIDLIAELLPVAALGWDPADGQVMDEKPRDPQHHILNRTSVLDLALSGLFIGSLSYASYLFFIQRSGVEPSTIDTTGVVYASAITMTYVTICLCQFANILVRRGHSYRQSLFSSYLWSNRKLLVAFCLSIGCMALISYNPLLQSYFGSGPLKLVDWGYAAGAASILVIARWVILRLVLPK